MRILVVTGLLLCSMVATTFADVGLDDIDPRDGRVFYVRLFNGDILTGEVQQIAQSISTGRVVTLDTDLGIIKVHEADIAEIREYGEQYRYRHRVYVMPSAAPIGDDHFIGLYELAFPYAGFGVGQWLSITGGRTFLPTVPWSDQISVVTAKITAYQGKNEMVEGGTQAYAFGIAEVWLNDVNPSTVLFANATFTGRWAAVTTMFFAKVAGADNATFRLGDLADPIPLTWNTGAFGIGLGVDARFSDRHDLRFIGEVWNNDLTRPANTVIFTGLRLANSAVGMDFGLTFVTAPAVIPTVSFNWTPF
jgi:hypothetical protein